LFTVSFETLLKQLYGLPVTLPSELIINGIRTPFINFDELVQKFKGQEINRYILNPMLQSWAGPPGTQNRIITLFAKNGLTYLAKVRYDQQSNQIYPPI
jgi:hypothetical protein